MAVFRIHLANGEGRIKADLKAADEALARLSAERWFGHTDWRIAEIRCLDVGPGLEPTELAGGGLNFRPARCRRFRLKSLALKTAC